MNTILKKPTNIEKRAELTAFEDYLKLSLLPLRGIVVLIYNPDNSGIYIFGPSGFNFTNLEENIKGLLKDKKGPDDLKLSIYLPSSEGDELSSSDKEFAEQGIVLFDELKSKIYNDIDSGKKKAIEAGAGNDIKEEFSSPSSPPPKASC